MSKKKKKAAKGFRVSETKPEVKATEVNTTNDAQMNARLQVEQAKNLQFCETWADEKILGINVIPALTYALVQILNRGTLEEIVG